MERSSSMPMASMFEPASAISEATFASTPRWFSTMTWIAAWKRRVVRVSHSTSIHWSGSFFLDRAMLEQSEAWTTSPWPFLIEPAMESPGIGRQQVASCTAMPSVPRIVTLPAVFSSSLESLVLRRRRATTAGRRLPSPRSASTSCFERAPPSRITRSQLASSISPSALLRVFRAWSSRRSPSPADSSYCMVFRKWRMLERALPVRTYCSQPGLGLAWLAVMISTRSPFRSSLLRGTSSPLTFAATQRLPMSVCTA